MWQAQLLQCTQFAPRENSIRLKNVWDHQALARWWTLHTQTRVADCFQQTPCQVQDRALTGCVLSDDAEDVGSTPDRPLFKSIDGSHRHAPQRRVLATKWNKSNRTRRISPRQRLVHASMPLEGPHLLARCLIQRPKELREIAAKSEQGAVAADRAAAAEQAARDRPRRRPAGDQRHLLRAADGCPGVTCRSASARTRPSITAALGGEAGDLSEYLRDVGEEIAAVDAVDRQLHRSRSPACCT